VSPVALADAVDASRFGGKAASLAQALRAGLPVPGGFALEARQVEAIAGGAGDAVAQLRARAAGMGALLAVRSSALGEDGPASSFAGQHVTVLGVRPEEVADAVVAVRDSASAAGAVAYRAKRGIAREARIGVIVQELVPAEVSAVVFTRNPVDRSDHILVEASWGLGESVVSGAVIPDRYVLAPSGRVVSRTIGEKDTAKVVRDGAVWDVDLLDERDKDCLGDDDLARIHALVQEVDRVWTGPHDLEVAIALGRIYMLQRRPVTA